MALGRNEALALWRRLLLTGMGPPTGELTQRQLALLATLYIAEGPHTVRGLAAGLGMSKPAVCRALDRLERLGFARRKEDEADRRNVLVQRTVKGAVFMSDLGDAIERTLEEPEAGDAVGKTVPGRE
ncbi:MAG TPA: MarR family transcriptional regulator [Hypericibacter adhaerens]|jgi:DNA-binding MarR family transcriptional regulator|uniref:MarR family transcriptional regulator n=1 Tax=Hypericibacter adhaerens TaxID=2602016 RepID=A0A5J6N0W2_9PROT|nr:MarR family transcriptional regulator [Hypericibacter adhaerens]QEX20536.1 MarR family transcriptional regulator [Hypericibacter adhaerens]HWA44413.1 MarR family transcriptional regulator [Hypericibacter adhaerens]